MTRYQAIASDLLTLFQRAGAQAQHGVQRAKTDQPRDQRNQAQPPPPADDVRDCQRNQHHTHNDTSNTIQTTYIAFHGESF